MRCEDILRLVGVDHAIESQRGIERGIGERNGGLGLLGINKENTAAGAN